MLSPIPSPVMPTFKMLRLPMLAQKCVCQQLPLEEMDPCALIRQTHLSTKLNNFLRLGKLQMETLRYKFSPHFNGLVILPFEGPAVMWPLFNSDIKSMDTIAQHVQGFMKFESIELQVRVKTDLTDLWSTPRKFDSIIFEEQTPKNGVSNSIEISSEDLIQILENVESEDTHLDVKVTEPFEYQPPKTQLKHRKLSIVNPNWLSFEHFLDLNVLSLTLKIQGDAAQKVNSILKQWIFGERRDLQHLIIDTDITLAYDLETVLDGIEATKSYEGDPPLLKHNAFLEIQRPQDNLKASVNFTSEKVNMVVWHTDL